MTNVNTMKKIITTSLMIAALFIGCNSSSNQNQSGKDCCKGVYSPKTLLDSAEYLVDKEVKVKAKVTRVCHCGNNITFTDIQDSTSTLYVLAGGDIPKFNQCLLNKNANITGVLRVNKITQIDLDSTIIKLENRLAELSAKSDSTSMKTCENIKAKIENTKIANQEKTDWMASHNQDFYPQYYLESVKFADCCVKKNDPEATASADECEKNGKSECCK